MSAVEYVARLRSLVEGKDPIAVQAETSHALARLIASIPEEKLNQQPSAGKWSLAAIVAHLAEAEVALSWRYRQIAEKEDAALPGYDQNLWCRLGDYESRDSQESLAQFRLLREANLKMFARFTPDDWRHSGIHAERGRLTMTDLVAQAAGHDLKELSEAPAYQTEHSGCQNSGRAGAANLTHWLREPLADGLGGPRVTYVLKAGG